MEHRPRNAFLLLAFVAFVPEIFSSETAKPMSIPSVTVTSEVPNASPVPTIVNNVITTPANNNSQKPVQIDLYYEALCSDSVKFVNDKLLPTYNVLSKYIGVQYIPFAQGEIINGTNNLPSYKCKREAECTADSIHACATLKINDPDKLLKFINCSLVEGQKNKTLPIEVCGNQTQIDATITESIKLCSNSSEWHSLFSDYSIMSKAAKVTSVPKIVINKNITFEEQDLKNFDLKKELCKTLLKEYDECKESGNGSGTNVVGVFPILIGVYYIIRMF